MTRSPFEALQQPDRRQEGQRGQLWTGRVAYIHRDDRKRLKFLFDVIPLSGWPSPSESVGGSDVLAGQVAAQRGVPRVRLAQPFVSALRSSTSSPTGIIVVPAVGSIVTVAMDDTGWIIVGFMSGPIITAGGADGRQAECDYNPGFEEATPAIVDASSVPWMFGIDEGDVILGKGDSRVKLNDIGVIVSSNPSCAHIYQSDGAWLYERYAQFERRAPGRLSYHKYLSGVSAKLKSFVASAPIPDSLVITTDIIESCPHLDQNRPYVIQQRGLITKSTQNLGRASGENLPLPTDISESVASGTYSVKRETVVAPLSTMVSPATELFESSKVVFDNQVGPDGSFHIRAGNLANFMGSSQLGGTNLLDLEIKYVASSKTFDISVLQTGTVLAAISIDGQAGALSLSAAKSISLKAPSITLEATQAIKLDSSNVVDIAAAGPLTLSAQNASLGASGVMKTMQDVMAGVISLAKHRHLHNDTPSGISTTQPPLP